MNLSQLNEHAEAYKERKRRGRGESSGLGKTSGRGTKGAASRSGYKRRPGYDGGSIPFYRRFPKRGFKNPFRKEYDTVSLADLEALAGVNEIDLEVLVASRVLKKRHGRLKVLGGGSLSRKLVVKANRFSESARQQIEKLGGEARTI